MSDHIGAGYGSEFHLLRYLGRYRNLLNDLIGKEIGGRVLEWLDFKPGNAAEYNLETAEKIKLPDHEIIGLDFLKNEHPGVFEQWKSFWPQSSNQQNWDGVCRAEINGVNHWLLVEAKANTSEIKSHCGAKPPSMTTKKAALSEMRSAFGLDSSKDLTKEYYQYANRLAVLHFLNKNRVLAKMIFIYFLGDKNPGKEGLCPRSADERKIAIKKQCAWLGLNPAGRKAWGLMTYS